jgi:predicted nuclease of restriction endonuclease-like RecB superfamily
LCRLSVRVEGEHLVPQYLDARDEPWLRALLDEHARFVGRPREELRARLREPLAVFAPKVKRRVAVHVLDRMGWSRPNPAGPPREARALLFRAAVEQPATRDRVRADVASALGVTAAELESALFADLPHEQRVAALPVDLSASQLGVSANQALLASCLRRAARVRIRAWGSARALVRYARQLGLICLVSRPPERPDNADLSASLCSTRAGLEAEERAQLDGVQLDLSGPFALFRRTQVYGRALASLVPRAAACSYFEMEADCAWGPGRHLSKLLIRSGDPIVGGRALSARESRLEARFVREFRRAAPEWEVLPDPCPVEAGETLIFPDVELVHRRDPSRRWLLEIVGFWTSEYLKQKLTRVQSAKLERLILCIDEQRCCNDEALPTHARVVRYRKRIIPGAVLQVIDPDRDG